MSHIWIGDFGPDAPKTYFTEEFSDAPDTPISSFVGDQGETFVDHDFMELSWLEEPIACRDLIKRHVTRKDEEARACQAAEARGMSSANLLVFVSSGDVSEPRDVEVSTHTLRYLGRFDTRPPPFVLEDAIAAAEAGDPSAQAKLGAYYLFPPPAQREMTDVGKAEYWLLKAAEAGQTQTYNRLYHVYSGAYGPAQPEKAFFWIEKAAQLGWVADMSHLSRMYADGTGTPQDDVLALKWAFLNVSTYDSDRYDANLREIAARLSREDIETAERLALQWIEDVGATARRFPGLVRNPIRDYLGQTG